MFTDNSKRSQAAKKLLSQIAQVGHLSKDPNISLDYYLFGGVVCNHLDSEINKVEFKFDEMEMFITAHKEHNPISVNDLIMKIVESLTIFGICRYVNETTKLFWTAKCITRYFCYSLYCKVDDEEIEINIVGLPDASHLKGGCLQFDSWYVNFDYCSELFISEPRTANDNHLAALDFVKRKVVLSYYLPSRELVYLSPFAHLIRRIVKMQERGWKIDDSIQKVFDEIHLCPLEDSKFEKCCASLESRDELEERGDKYVVKCQCHEKNPHYLTVDSWCSQLNTFHDKSDPPPCPMGRVPLKL
jgi:hypothetical protein